MPAVEVRGCLAVAHSCMQRCCGNKVAKTAGFLGDLVPTNVLAFLALRLEIMYTCVYRY